MKFYISTAIEVDPDANFLNVDENELLSVIEDLVSNALYDIDDIQVEFIEVSLDD